MNSNYLVIPELGSAYRWNSEYQVLETCPLKVDNTPDEANWGEVEPDLVGDEIVTYKGKEVSFRDLYQQLESKLK